MKNLTELKGDSDEIKGKLKKKYTVPTEKPGSADFTGPDKDADKSGTDINSDETETGYSKNGAGKFDKPKREVDPDRTDIDTKSDKTKQNNLNTEAPVRTEKLN